MAGNAIRHSEFQDTPVMTLSPLYRKPDVARFVSTDKVVGMLGEFPELTKAVREGDLETVSILCAQVFILNPCQASCQLFAQLPRRTPIIPPDVLVHVLRPLFPMRRQQSGLRCH